MKKKLKKKFLNEDISRVIELIFQTEGFWEKFWISFVDIAGESTNINRRLSTALHFTDVNEHDFMVWVTSLTIILLYWTLSLFFLFLDLTGVCKKYKVQPGKNEPVEISKVLSVSSNGILDLEFIN